MLTPELKPTTITSPMLKMADNSESELEQRTAMSQDSQASQHQSELQLLKDKFKRDMLNGSSRRHRKKDCKTKANWTEEDIDAYVKTVRRHGKSHAKLREALHGKSKCQIKRFTKTLCKQIEAMPDHPELDLLDVLMDVSSDEEDCHPRSLLEEERERKRKQRNKLKMVGIALSVTAVPTVEPVSKPKAPAVPIENLEQQIKQEAENTGKGAI